jgi:Na+/H+ antiporter NhaD/arsenite permease-like protein
MWISVVLLLILFVSLLILIARDVMERAALSLVCALLSFFILITIEHADPTVFVGFIFGTIDDKFMNFHTITLIFGIMVISTICYQTGLFQFLAFKMIQLAKGDSKKVFIIINILTFSMSAILEDTITAIILIPLTITVCRTLKLPSVPYVISQSLVIKLGATVLPISSIPSIMITSAQEISFAEYFSTAGLVSILIMITTIVLFVILFRKQFPTEKPRGLEGFLQYNPWIFVKNRKMMLISFSTFLFIIFGFIFIPSDVLEPDAIALTGAVFLLLVNRVNAGEILKEIDFNLILYLLGIFVVTGSLQYVGVIDFLGQSLNSLGITNVGLAFLVLLWVGALASAFIDNIPITQLLLSIINILMGEKGSATAKFGSAGLALGVIWGDNLSPFGDSILALNVAKKNGVSIQPIEFLKIGLPVTLFQLSLISLVIFLLFDPIIGVVMLVVLVVLIYLLFLIGKQKKNNSTENKHNFEIELPHK